MISKLGRGTSFKGLGAYLLHDKGAESSERVIWTQARNLATSQPEAAIGVMAATALDQTRLKSAAGIKATGRKSKESVLHVTLSWHPDEAKTLTRDEMVRAADGAIAALGADEHQSLVVAHGDSDHPHVHLVINRVSPDDGRMLSSSKEKLKLSKWALEYEKARGPVLCKERELNAAARERGHFTRAKKDKPRHIFELEAANENHQEAAFVQSEQREADRALQRENALAMGRHAAAWRDLEDQHRADKAALRLERRNAVERAKSKVVEEHRDEWRLLQTEHDQKNVEFESREVGLLGKASNALRSINWRGLLSAKERPATIKETFDVISSKGARVEKLKAEQEAQTGALRTKESAAKKDAAAEVVREFKQRALETRSKRLLERAHLEFTQSLEKAALRSKWRARGEQRKRAWSSLERRSEQRSRDLMVQERPEQTQKAVAHMDKMREARDAREAAPVMSRKDALRERMRRARDQNQDRDVDREC